MIRRARPEDAAAMAALWNEVEPGSAWSLLGPPAGRAFFRRYAVAGPDVGLVAWEDGTLLGACVGTARPERRLYGRHTPALALAVLRAVVARPGAVRHLARATGPGGAGGADLLARPGTAYMENFFVAAQARGRRLGTLLLDRFAAEMAERGCRWCVVHTTADNVGSQRAQERAGFECVRRDGDDLFYVRALGA